MSTGTAQPLQGEIETPRPLRAPDGQVIVVGWCLVTDLAHPPPVRLRTIAGIISLTERIERSDVPALLPDQPAAAHCGFILSGRLPAGVYLAEIEAQVPGGSWQVFRRLTLAVERRHLAAAVESPCAEGVVTE